MGWLVGDGGGGGCDKFLLSHDTRLENKQLKICDKWSETETKRKIGKNLINIPQHGLQTSLA